METKTELLNALKKSVSDLNTLLNGEGAKKSLTEASSNLVKEHIIDIGTVYGCYLDVIRKEKREKRRKSEDTKMPNLYKAMADDGSVRSDGSVYLTEGMVIWPDGSVTPE